MLIVTLAVAAHGATRPQYGGTLRVEVRQNPETPDPPPLLTLGFTIARWEAGRRAVYEADENAPGGRPFLDGVEIVMGRSLRDQSNDLELGRADVVELGPAELRRLPAGRKIWSSSPVRVLALVFAPRFDDARVREALALAVDRSAIHAVLLQRQGEISGALLPQWLSGYAFLFPDSARPGARAATGRRRTADHAGGERRRAAADRRADRAECARCLAARVGDCRSRRTPMCGWWNCASRRRTRRRRWPDWRRRSALPEPARADSPEQMYAAERGLLEGFRVIPLIHLPDVYGVARGREGRAGSDAAGRVAV